MVIAAALLNFSVCHTLLSRIPTKCLTVFETYMKHIANSVSVVLLKKP